MLWLEDGSVILKEIGAAYDLKMLEPNPGEGILTYTEGVTAGARSMWIGFGEILRNPAGTVTGGLEPFLQKEYQNFIELNGIPLQN